MKGFAIVLNRCPHGVEMISLDNDSGGVNLTGNKCCGRWSVVKEWYMPHRLLVGAILELEEAAALSAKATDGASKTPGSQQASEELDELLRMHARHDNDDTEDCWTKPAVRAIQYLSDLRWDLQVTTNRAAILAETNESLRRMIADMAAYAGTTFGADEPVKNAEVVKKALAPSPASGEGARMTTREREEILKNDEIALAIADGMARCADVFCDQAQPDRRREAARMTHKRLADSRELLADLRAEAVAAWAAAEAAEERCSYKACGCMYDRKDDVCSVHSPIVSKVTAERDAARSELAALLASRAPRPAPQPIPAFVNECPNGTKPQPSVEEMAERLHKAWIEYHGITDPWSVATDYWLALARTALSAMPAPDEKRVAELESQLAEARKGPPTWACPEHGPTNRCDEDRCCVSCGEDLEEIDTVALWNEKRSKPAPDAPKPACEVYRPTPEVYAYPTESAATTSGHAPKPEREPQGEALSCPHCAKPLPPYSLIREREPQGEPSERIAKFLDALERRLDVDDDDAWMLSRSDLDYLRACLSRAPSPSDGVVRNLAMLVRRIKAYPKNREKLIDEAIDYCNRAGVGGSILRDVESPSPSPALAAIVEAGDAMRNYFDETTLTMNRVKDKDAPGLMWALTEEYVSGATPILTDWDRARAALPKGGAA